MKKVMQAILVLLAVTIFWVPTGNAQVTLSQSSGPNFSLTNSVFPNLNYPVATVTGTGTAKFFTGGVSSASIRITGTYSASLVNIQVSNDNVNFTTVPLQNYGLGSSVTALTGASTVVNGLYSINLAGMTQIQVNATSITGTSMILKFVGSATVGPTIEVAPDPCLTAVKVQVPIPSGTGTTQIAAPVTGQQVFVCGVYVVGAATMTVQVNQGTGATCGTGTTTLTGVMTPATGSAVQVVDAGPAILSNGVCVVIATAAGAGWATIVQR
jgi:hypothetical protein